MTIEPRRKISDALVLGMAGVALTLGGFIAGASGFVSANAERTDQTRRDVAVFTTRLDGLEKGLGAKIDAVQSAVAPMPEAFASIRRDLTAHEAKDRQLEDRIVALEHDVGGMKADQAAIAATINLPLRGGRK